MGDSFWTLAAILAAGWIIYRLEKIMAISDDLKTDFSALKDIAAKAITQLVDVERQLKAAVAANDPTPLAQLHADVAATNADLAAQLAAAVPADPAPTAPAAPAA